MITYISNLGMKDEFSRSVKKHIVLSNRVNMLVGFAMISGLLADVYNIYILGMPAEGVQYIGTSILLFTSLGHLILNANGYFKVTRISILLMVPLFMIFWSPMMEGTIDEYYFWYPYIPICTTLIAFLLFTDQTDSKWLLGVLSIYFFLVVFMKNILDQFAPPDLRVLSIVEENQFFYSFLSTMIFLFVNITLYYVFSQSWRFERELGQAQSELQQKNLDLGLVNQQLLESNQAKNKFFSIIAHDLRGSLGSVLGLSELLSKDTETLAPQEIKDYTTVLYDSSKNTFKLLENLLDWSQIQTGSMDFDPKDILISQVAEDTINLMNPLAIRKQVSLSLACSGPISVKADANMIATVCRNMISNAVKFTNEGDEIVVTIQDQNDTVQVSVKDSGVGMSSDKLDNLFKVSERVSSLGTQKELGTGLGLNLCKEFVEKHNGHISVVSEINKGSEFIFSIPRSFTN